ncbi:hypothetical protein STTU_2654 [Streptomyces sp. Tu6071]|nr:hypothetical protein STTU_2654 [Streptomyces sp. Tu6071]
MLVAPALQRLRDGRVPGGPLEGEDRARGADGGGAPRRAARRRRLRAERPAAPRLPARAPVLTVHTNP